METCLSIEGKLNIVLSTKFRCFWDAHIIEDAVDFQVARAALGPGEFGTVEALEGSDFEWEIDIRDDLNDLETEITLAHELMHVLLHHQRHPAICLSDKCGVQASSLWDGIAVAVLGILSHPIIWPRLERYWGNDLDIHWEKQLVEFQTMVDKQTPSDKWDELSACLSYVQNRLDGLTCLCEKIKRRFPRIASRGELATKWLLDQGYSEAEKLTANQVIQVGINLLKRISVDGCLCVCVRKETGEWEGV
jgi:hypothetical protein